MKKRRGDFSNDPVKYVKYEPTAADFGEDDDTAPSSSDRTLRSATNSSYNVSF